MTFDKTYVKHGKDERFVVYRSGDAICIGREGTASGTFRSTTIVRIPEAVVQEVMKAVVKVFKSPRKEVAEKPKAVPKPADKPEKAAKPEKETAPKKETKKPKTPAKKTPTKPESPKKDVQVAEAADELDVIEDVADEKEGNEEWTDTPENIEKLLDK